MRNENRELTLQLHLTFDIASRNSILLPSCYPSAIPQSLFLTSPSSHPDSSWYSKYYFFLLWINSLALSQSASIHSEIIGAVYSQFLEYCKCFYFYTCLLSKLTVFIIAFKTHYCLKKLSKFSMWHSSHCHQTAIILPFQV